ncbi:hypothetical protein BSU04_36155 [Caballeronia sordidicola]|uniref:Uncharacterized protein n=1 Tax=Caballeronia sordidicola TaxID=196367 RepID=A0A226WSP2_CABSO|nr:hypothetical protein BSU04_36155 [Caballeronia sordidicola]
MPIVLGESSRAITHVRGKAFTLVDDPRGLWPGSNRSRYDKNKA